jgi:hypothetical protein
MRLDSKPIQQMEENSTGDETNIVPDKLPRDNTVEQGENSFPEVIKSVPASEETRLSQVSGEPSTREHMNGNPKCQRSTSRIISCLSLPIVYCATSGLIVVMDPFILGKVSR